MVTLRWPNASWELLTPQQPQAGGASGYNQPALEAPAPRKGHTATLLPSGEMVRLRLVGRRRQGGGAG